MSDFATDEEEGTLAIVADSAAGLKRAAPAGRAAGRYRHQSPFLATSAAMNFHRPTRVLLLLVALPVVGLSGCQWMETQMAAMRGEGFQDWNNGIGGSNLRGKSNAKPSGFFVNEKSAQIEKNLGGDFD